MSWWSKMKRVPESRLNGQATRKIRIRRVAALDRVEAVPAPDLQRQPHLVEERRAVFQKIPRRPAGIEGQGMAIDVDAVDLLVGRLVSLAGGADDRDLGPCPGEGAAFVPDPAVEGQGEVLDDDQHLASRERPARGELRHVGHLGRGLGDGACPVHVSDPRSSTVWPGRSSALIVALVARTRSQVVPSASPLETSRRSRLGSWL